MDNRPASEYAQSDQTSAAASAHYSHNHTPQPEVRPPQYTPQPDVRPPNIPASNTPQSDYGLNPPPTRSPAYQDYLPRPQSYTPNSQPGGVPSMAQASSPSLPISPMPIPRSPNLKSDAALPLDPSLPANSPTYPPPYSPYQPQGHDMQYQGHPPPPHQMYARPEWPHTYGGHSHGLPGPYASPATTVGSASPAPATAGLSRGQVYSFVPIPGAQQHKRPRRRYEEIERMYKCGWNGCEKAYGTLNHLNAHVTMQSHGAKRTPEEFKEIRKEWKARKKEEDGQRKAAEERERAAAQAAQASHVDAPGGPSDPQAAQPSAYGGGVRPQLPPIGYQPADSQVPGQYGGPGGGLVYQSNGQMGYPPNYPHSPYPNGHVYQPRE
ncbi:hypothetical protein N7466_001690 [Penicillium verhagenii]|uniref:uncharacterized protein n=1 Tax=Penicillium verhagenii TaxID=1562060 RepID=UPI00254597C5|nr:uncharacterized protein N7466_001690 [Penicillium verhagenii]KAJ5938556.1 hypothetical protein N7466_001690 [Penicillium verhagenii]